MFNKNVCFYLVAFNFSIFSQMAFSSGESCPPPEGKRKGSLGDLVEGVARDGLKHYFEGLESKACITKDDRSIWVSELNDKSASEVENSRMWYLSPFSEKYHGFFLSLPLGEHAFRSPMKNIFEEYYDCMPGSAIVGTKVYKIPNQDARVIESWSCGTAGCEHSYIFTGKSESEQKKYCKYPLFFSRDLLSTEASSREATDSVAGFESDTSENVAGDTCPSDKFSGFFEKILDDESLQRRFTNEFVVNVRFEERGLRGPMAVKYNLNKEQLSFPIFRRDFLIKENRELVIDEKNSIVVLRGRDNGVRIKYVFVWASCWTLVAIENLSM